MITAVHEPTDWLNSIVCNIKETPEGRKKIRLCLDAKDLNKNIRREHYYTRTIDELLPQVYGKKFFSGVDTKKRYWHVALDLLLTCYTPLIPSSNGAVSKGLPLGVKSSQAIFQRKLDEVYKDIPNAMGIALLATLSYVAQPNQVTSSLVARASSLEASLKHNVSLNSEKLLFK